MTRPSCLAAAHLMVSRVALRLVSSFCLCRRASASNHCSSLAARAPSSCTSRASKSIPSQPRSQPHCGRPNSHSASTSCSLERTASSRLFLAGQAVSMALAGLAASGCAACFTWLIRSLAPSKREPHHRRKAFQNWACTGQISSRVISPDSSGSSSFHRPSALPPGNLKRAMASLNSWKFTRPFSLRSKCLNQAFNVELSLSQRKARKTSTPVLNAWIPMPSCAKARVHDLLTVEPLSEAR
mmetsp:Transcript_68552/g.189738  ORF Transcript_68552/g.189738 Transcript_68552/m.189738 type:complete len:241 (-) Transcript_68552:6-728(-)